MYIKALSVQTKASPAKTLSRYNVKRPLLQTRDIAARNDSISGARSNDEAEATAILS